jgi:hypothetical protein
VVRLEAAKGKVLINYQADMRNGLISEQADMRKSLGQLTGSRVERFD